MTVSIALQGLTAGTTYHYRLLAINRNGKSYGADGAFTTPVYSGATSLMLTLPSSPVFVPTPFFPQVMNTTTQKSKELTRAQKLANALKACGRELKTRRASCESQAHKRYGSKAKAKKTKR